MNSSRTLKALVILATLVFGLPILIRIFVDRNILSDIEETKQRLRELDVATDLEELQAKLPNDPELFEAAEKYWEAFDALGPDIQERIPHFESENDVDVHALEYQAFLDDAAQFLKKNADALKLVYRATQADAARFDVDYSLGPSTDISHLSPLRDAVSILCTDARVAAANGEPERAARALASAFRASNALNHKAILISQLVRVAINRIACLALPEVLSLSELSHDQLASIDQEIYPENARPSFRIAYSGELILSDVGYQRIISGNVGEELLVSSTFQDIALRRLRWIPFGTVWVHANRRESFRYMERLILEFDKDHSQFTDGIPRLEELASNIPDVHFLARITLPAFARSLSAHIEDVAHLRLAKAMIAVEQQRLDSGTLPDTLSDLPSIKESDPYTDEPFQYEKESDSEYVIYSVGNNLVDDNARSFEKGSSQRENGDWYLRVRR